MRNGYITIFTFTYCLLLEANVVHLNTSRSTFCYVGVVLVRTCIMTFTDHLHFKRNIPKPIYFDLAI